ncbi:MAG TPA: hypothetical protein VMV10_23975 [Pirellulales bacterium]|nr:hypothetical protein [Pirellulales bacterium]
MRAGEILTFVGRNGCLSGNADGDPAIEWVREVESLRRALYALDVSQRNPDTELLKLMAPEAAILLRQLLNERLSGVATALDEQLHLTAGTGRLVDAIWMQVAVAAHSRRRIAKCHRCGTFFEPAGVAAQAGRSYCSHACKIAAYRARQRKAAEMREKGASVREIAKSVGSDVETVKGWLSKGDK